MKKSILALGLLGTLVAGCAYDPYNGGYGYGPGRPPVVAGGPPPAVVQERRQAAEERRAYRAGVREGEERAASRAWREDQRGW
jgi:hypothetical protein